MSEAKTSKMTTGRIVTIIVGATLVGALGFFIYKYADEKAKNTENISSIEGLTVEIDDLENDILNYQNDLQQSQEVIDKNEMELLEKEQMIADKQREIDRLLKLNKISASEAASLKERIASLNYYLKKYQAENDELKMQIAEMSGEIENLEGKINTMSRKMFDINREKEGLGHKVKTASILAAREFSFFRFKGSGKEVQESEFRGRQLDELKICFTIVRNTAAEKGEKEVYLQIRDSKGAVVKGTSSGKFTNYMKEEVDYSTKSTFEFDGTDTNICLKYIKPGEFDFADGEYVVEAFCDGYDIGKSSFVVK